MGIPITLAAPRVETKQGAAARAFAVLIPLAMVSLLNALCRPDMDGTLRLVSSVTSLVCCIPLSIHLWRRSTDLPFLPALGLIYGVQFVWSVFLQDRYTAGDVSRSFSEAVML